MFTVTRELYHAEMAKAVYANLREFLLSKEKNHCQRVEFLPHEVMQMTCERLRDDVELRDHGVEAFVLAEKATEPFEIESGALIEKRNRAEFGVLTAFIPQGLRLPAEDSYDIQTFKTYDFGGVLREQVRRLIESIPPAAQVIVRKVLNQPAAKQQTVDKHIKYLLAIKNDAGGWQEAGAYLPHLGLIPDFDLEDKGLETRIDRNAHCIAALAHGDRSPLASIESLVAEYGLDPESNQLRHNLVSFLRERDVTAVDRWVATILEDSTVRSRLSFDKWKFKDITNPGEIEIHLDPLEDPKSHVVAKGLKKEGDNLVASTDPKTPLHLKWSTFPKKAENLGHFLVMVLRDAESGGDTDNELLRKVVTAGRSSLKLALKEIELELGETCVAKIVIHAKDAAGVILDSDESESFWIEGGVQIEEQVKKVDRVRNRAEAFFAGAYRSQRIFDVDSEGWEEGSPRHYRLKLQNREVFRIVINATLYQIERRNLSEPATCGAWSADLRNRSILELSDLRPAEITAEGFPQFKNFLDARRRLFARFDEADTNSVIESLDLLPFKEPILAYVETYTAILSEVRVRLEKAKSDGQINNVLNSSARINRIDTVHLTVGTADDFDEVILLAPTHPVRLLWVLQYQQMLNSWSQKLCDAPKDRVQDMVNPESVGRITSLNIPSSIAFGKGETYINSDNLDLYWSVLPKSGTQDVRKVVSQVLRTLGFKSGVGEITTITPQQVADKIWRYLKHHPYVSTLRINVLNPGDGLLILNAIRELQKSDDFVDLRYDVAFYGDLGHELMGSAFDEIMEEKVLAEGSNPEIDEALLRSSRNPLFPKLMFSKIRVKPAEWTYMGFREAHITVLIDQFSTKVLSRPAGNSLGSFSLHNLLAGYRADFDLHGESATWSRKVVPSQNSEIAAEDHCAEAIFRLDDLLLRTGACYYDWGNSLDKVPAIQLELSDKDKHVVGEIHEKSDWIFTIDRNFGIEYFDNPRGIPGSSVRSYLIDYTPEFLDGLGHRLIVSTFWLSEIEGLIQDGFRKMGIPAAGFQATQVLDVLKSISGRLALKLINNPKDAREIIGLALTRLILQSDEALEEGILVPVDSHIDLFAERKRQLADADISIHRSDLLYVRPHGHGLSVRLVEVKFRSGTGSPSEEMLLKEAIAQKNADTEGVLVSKFASTSEFDRLDRDIQNKELATLLEFYFDRAKRHGLMKEDSVEAERFDVCLRKIEAGDVDLVFERSGYIFNLQGVSKPSETYKDNQVVVVGRKRIFELLEIPLEDEVGGGGSTSEGAAAAAPLTVEKEPGATVTQDVGGLLKALEVVHKTETQIYAVTGPEQSVKPLESTPAILPRSSSMRVVIGLDCDTGNEVSWDPYTTAPKKLANQHVLIVGKSGAGKTQSLSAFLAELAHLGVPSVIFDFQGEYMSEKLANANGASFLAVTGAQVLDAADGIDINPLEVPTDPGGAGKQNFTKTVYQVAASLAKIFALGDIQHAVLRDAIGQAFSAKGFVPGQKETWVNPAPVLSEVWAILKHKEKFEGANVRNLNLRVQPLFDTGVFIGGSASTGIGDALRKTTIIRLSNLATSELMSAVSRFVLQKIYFDMLSLGVSDQLRVFAVVDEAHKLSYDETLTSLIREARKYGVGICLASQSVKDFDSVVFDIVGTKITLQLEGDDARVMADNLGLVSKSDRDIALGLILNQPPHRALIRSNHFEPYSQVDVTPFYRKS